MESRNKNLRSGYTTGACAAAAAKAATLFLMRNSECGMRNAGTIEHVEIPFPDGSRIQFKVQSSKFKREGSRSVAEATVIKDAGDDPDVTHGAEIVATVQSSEFGVQSAVCPEIMIKGGKGVGSVTKPGLAVPMGEAAINPVPRKMIREAVREAILEFGVPPIKTFEGRLRSMLGEKKPNSEFRIPNLEVTISVPAGEELAKKTLNHRLGIIGGISILGTTGIVRPVSAEAWTATITASMDVAQAMGHSVVVLSSGRTSEKAHMRKFHFPDESYVMMGDYIEFALVAAKQHGFREIHLCAQWAKMVKTAMSMPQTHVRHGALDVKKAMEFLKSMAHSAEGMDREFNTAREMYEYIHSQMKKNAGGIFTTVCQAAKRYCEEITEGLPVSTHLVSYEGIIVAESE